MGWYPEYDPDGQFIIQLIKNELWSNPTYKYRCRSQDELHNIIEIVINHVDS